MVLTNFECWAHGESDAVSFETGTPARNSSIVDPFNARVVSHIASASNGYYGYALVNNASAASDNNNNNCNNTNHSVQAMAMQVSEADANVDVDVAATATARCKKRCFGVGNEQLEMDNLTAVKRCRFDDADLVAQYCNDFFSLPATQAIGTQACLMDYDYDMQQQQQSQLQQQQQEQQQQQPLQQVQPRIHQNYQGHLHRANRDTAHQKSSRSNSGSIEYHAMS